MQTMTITQARKNLFELAKTVLASEEDVRLTTKSGNLIVMSEQNYSGAKETEFLSANLRLKRSIIEGMKAPLKESADEKALGWDLK